MFGSRRKKLSFVLLASVLLVAVGLGAAPADESASAGLDPRSLHAENSRALPNAYLVTLSLVDGDRNHQFSAVTASRYFTLSPAELRLDFHGSLNMQLNGRELLDYTVELQQHFVQEDGGSHHTRVGNWKGSTYIETDRTIPIIESPRSKLTVRLKKL